VVLRVNLCVNVLRSLLIEHCLPPECESIELGRKVTVLPVPCRKFVQKNTLNFDFPLLASVTNLISSWKFRLSADIHACIYDSELRERIIFIQNLIFHTAKCVPFVCFPIIQGVSKITLQL
jgi:hypothetical protein